MNIFNDKSVFGSSCSGGIYVHLKLCEIKLFGGDALFFSVGGDKSMHGFSIMFSNHDKKYNEAEKYISELPKEYKMIMRCSHCGTRMNETHAVPALYFILDTLPGLSAPFNAPRCPKCEYKSYSDINFAIKTDIYKIATNRPITVKSLEKIHAKE